eukprot:gene3097-6079_t
MATATSLKDNDVTVNTTIEINDAMYNGLKKYGETHKNNCNIPGKHKAILEDGSISNLGTWLQRQRYDFHKGILKDKRKILLQQLVDSGQLDWKRKRHHNESWMEHYNDLVAYIKQNEGNVNLFSDTNNLVPDGRKIALGQWLRTQRNFLRLGTLRSDRKTLLQDLVDEGSFSWQWIEWSKDGRLDNALWNRQYEALLKYGDEHDGDCNIPLSEKYMMSDGSLGQWLATQRKLNNKNILRPDRKEILQRLVDAGKLAWSFDMVELNTDNEAWDIKYTALIEYGKKNGGDCNIPYRELEELNDGVMFSLGAWLQKQRQMFKSNELRQDRQARLQQLVDAGKLKWIVRVEWELRYNSLVSYAKKRRGHGQEHGHGGECEIRYTYEGIFDHGYDDFMGRWLHYQKVARKKGILLPERERKLQLLVDQGMLSWETKSSRRQSPSTV